MSAMCSQWQNYAAQTSSTDNRYLFDLGNYYNVSVQAVNRWNIEILIAMKNPYSLYTFFTYYCGWEYVSSTLRLMSKFR